MAAFAVVHGELPVRSAVVAAARQAELEGAELVVTQAVASVVQRHAADAEWPTVRVVREAVLVDVHNTAVAGIATGVQRVTREVSRRGTRTRMS